MRLMRIVVECAFHDCMNVDVDHVREQIFRAVSDGLEAEVLRTSNATQWDVTFADPNEDSSYEAWQEQAHEKLDEKRSEALE